MKSVTTVFVFSLTLCSSIALAQPTCCLRTVAALPIDSTGLSWAFLSPIHTDCARSDCHPYDIISVEGREELEKLVDAIGRIGGAEPDPEAQKIVSEMLDLDYLFRGELSTVGGTEGPASHTLRMQFFDHHRGESVKEGHASWTGIVGDGFDEVRDLARKFLPLDELMVDYERIPETATVEPEKDSIANGDRMTVHVRDIVDRKERPSQPWQWILVKTEKGKILNGEVQGEGYRRFEVGNGSVNLSYKAPDACMKQTDTITIYNSCNNDPRTVVNLIPEREIAVGSFEIRCVPKNTWTGTITYARSYNKTNIEEGPNNSTVKMQEIVSENAHFDVHGWPFSHEYEGSVGTDLYYEGEEDSLTGSYSGKYKKITTVRTPEGTSTTTDTASCQAIIRDSGYLLINNEEMRAYLELGVSFVGDEPCHGQSVYSGPRGSFTMEFDWDQLETFAGLGYLESSIPAKNPRTVTGSYSVPIFGITWSWNLTRR